MSVHGPALFEVHDAGGPSPVRRIAIIAALGLLATMPLPAYPAGDAAGCQTKRCERRVALRAFAHEHGGCRSWGCIARVTHKRWARLRAAIPGALKARLATLRWCESTDNYSASNGTHWGAYQFSWGRGSAGERAGFTVRPDLASPAEQDVRTARFFPSHSGEWECRA